MEQKNMLPGLTREAEEQKLQEIIGIAQQNLERARADIRKVNEDLEDLLDVYEAQDKEGLALWNNATARLKENEYDLVRYEKARRKPYFGRIDFKDPNVKGDESYYIEVIVVGAGADAVDYKLISICHKGDVVVSQDYGVAAMALGKGAYAIHQSGKWYTNENIDQMLMERHLNKKARRSSHKNHMKGPRKRTEEDDVRFAQSFEKLIQMAKAKEGAQSGII